MFVTEVQPLNDALVSKFLQLNSLLRILKINDVYITIYVYYMAELAIRSVRKMTPADWLPIRSIRLSYRPASFGGTIFE